MPPRVLPAGDPDALAAAVAALAAGDLVVVPTETVYGVACALDVAALDRLLEAKGRAATKGVTLAIDAVAQAAEVADLPDAARRLADAFWPGPLTLVLPARPQAALPPELTGGSGAVGLRLPDHPTPRAIARETGAFPLTSANRSGGPDARTAAEALAALGDAVAIVLDGGPVRGGVPSTVVRVEAAGAWTILRPGAIDSGAIESTVGGG